MNKFMLISGGTKGIGKAIIEKFAENGFDIATCSRNEKDLERLKKEIEKKYKSKVYIQKADLSDKKETFAFADFVKSLNRKIDVLVNNTGFFIPGAIAEEADDTLEKMIHTNLYSAYYLTKAFVKEMIAQKDGYIFNICSIASIIAYPNGGSYSISKFALYGMTKVLREELKSHQIRVSAVLPGATLTASWEGEDLPTERFIKTEDIAEAVFSAYSLSKQSVVEEIIIRPQLGDI